MAENVIYVRTTRAKIRQAIAKAVATVTGAGGDAREAADSMKVRMGMAMLRNIRKAFVVKAAGGTDECGLSWKPLSPKTIAYSRRHPGMPDPKVRADFAPSWMLTRTSRVNEIVAKWRQTGKVGNKKVATESEARREAVKKIGIKAKPETDSISRWWSLFRQGLARGMGKSGAAKYAWWQLKREGANTIFSVFSTTPVQILRSTGLLLNSLTPGINAESPNVPSSPPSVENQVFTLGSSDLIVGTNRKHAATHHEGKGNVPQRRLWAEPSQWPQEWWDDIADAGKTGMVDVLLHVLRNP